MALGVAAAVLATSVVWSVQGSGDPSGTAAAQTPRRVRGPTKMRRPTKGQSGGGGSQAKVSRRPAQVETRPQPGRDPNPVPLPRDAGAAADPGPARDAGTGGQRDGGRTPRGGGRRPPTPTF
ncbi:MAG: hypothetical protein IT379_09060 [Deltaproteobacteria bacterium]|nr:hypothetical protein [Deltaproteobacteria bacterium]